MAHVPLALDVIKREHIAMAAMLKSIPMLLAQCHRQGVPPPFDGLRCMLFYLDEFPERRHHKKETELLFPKLRARTPQHRDLLDRLDRDHHRGELRIRELEHALLAFEVLGESRRIDFETLAQLYVDSYLAHMRLEEAEVLPLALKVLTKEDWDELSEAFSHEQDPLASGAPEAQYESLFTRIVAMLPAPVGLGASPGSP